MDRVYTCQMSHYKENKCFCTFPVEALLESHCVTCGGSFEGLPPTFAEYLVSTYPGTTMKRRVSRITHTHTEAGAVKRETYIQVWFDIVPN